MLRENDAKWYTLVMFSSFLENPTGCSFEGQDGDENIILLARAHPITNLRWIIPAILIFLTPFLLPTVAASLGINLFLNLPETYNLAFLVINYLLVLVIVFEGFLHWYFNVNIVTNKKIVDVDFDSILFKSVDLAPLDDIQEVTPSIGGLFGIIFNFGNVFVQTSGARIDIDFKNVPHPDRVADIVIDQADIHRNH